MLIVIIILTAFIIGGEVDNKIQKEKRLDESGLRSEVSK
jgi:hypothetical protein